MKRKRRKSGRKSRPWMVSGGFDPECEMCRALHADDGEIFGEAFEVDGAEIREILDLERAHELWRRAPKGPWSWSMFDDDIEA